MKSLPKDIFEKIFQQLSLRDVFACSRVCLHWKQIIDQEKFWRELLKTRFNLKPSQKKFASSILQKKWDGNCYMYTIDYVFEHFPVVLRSGIITPHDFHYMEIKNSKNLAIALAKLKILLKGYV